MFETVLDGPVSQVRDAVAADPNQRRGEFVLILEGAGEDADARIAEGRRLYARLGEYLKPSQAAKVAAELSGAPRKALYGGE
jgi:16S rRNA (cytidine1402-2'-O)-methyltransferase